MSYSSVSGVASTPSVTVSYDSFGRTSSVASTVCTLGYSSYDDAGNLLTQTTTYPALPSAHQTFTLSYGYNPNGSRNSLSTPGGTFGYGYDGLGRPTSVTNPASQSFGWGYDDGNRLTSQTTPQTQTTATYNALSELIQLVHKRAGTGGAVLAQYGNLSTSQPMLYDAAGNRTSVTASVPGNTTYGGTTTYGYTAKNELSSETSSRVGGYAQSHVYDTAGNPTTFRNASGQTYNADNQSTASNLSYDGNGNPVIYNHHPLAFDAENRMTSYSPTAIEPPGGGDNNAKTNARTNAGNTGITPLGNYYGYRPDGLRAWKSVNGTATCFLYDGGTLLAELDASGNVTSLNTWGVTGLAARSFSTRTLLHVYDASGNLSEQVDASSGSVVATYAFDGYGGRTVSSSDSAATSDPCAGYGSAAGYYTDNETGLTLCGHRYYDSANGRWLTRDPIGYEGGVNLYSYCGNNGVGRIDPNGLNPPGSEGPAEGYYNPYPGDPVQNAVRDAENPAANAGHLLATPEMVENYETQCDLYAGAGSKSGTGPRVPRIEGFKGRTAEQNNDFKRNEEGNVPGAEGEFPGGASLFDSIDAIRLDGKIYRLPRGTRLPSGWKCKADGENVGGPRSKGHYSMYPEYDTDPALLHQHWSDLPWQDTGASWPPKSLS